MNKREEEKIAIRCPTEELWEKVVAKAENLGWSFSDSYLSTGWNVYGSDVCVDLYSQRNSKKLMYSPKNFFEREGYTIIPAEEWLLEQEVVIGSTWRNKASGKVHTIIGTDDRGWYRTDIGGLSPKKDYVRNCTLVENPKTPEFKVGDEVEVVRGGLNLSIGDKGIITKWDGCCFFVQPEDGEEEPVSPKRLKHTKKTPTYSVPLRVGDRVRVVGGGGSQTGDSGNIKGIPNGIAEVLLDGDKYNSYYELQDLELIPTEKDITVGSVWESEWGERRKITSINNGVVSWVNLEDSLTGSVDIKLFIDFDKLIHRVPSHRVDTEGELYVEIGRDEKGLCMSTYKDEARTELIHTQSVSEPSENVNVSDGMKYYLDSIVSANTMGEVTLINLKQTNKKETRKGKKMNIAKVVKEKMKVMDRDCSNKGEVVSIHPDTEQVLYRDLEEGSLHLVSISRLYIPLTMPKPKPEKKTAKKCKKASK